MAYFVELTSRGFLPPGTDVDTLIRETGFESMLVAVLDTYHHRRTPLEELKRESDQRRVKTWQRMLQDTAPVTPLQALAASHRLTELLVGSRWYVMRDAREDDSSWSEIGAALGITKQGAQDWYRRKIDEQARHVSPSVHDAERSERALRDQ